MTRNQCLFCYKNLSEDDRLSLAGKAGYHPACSKKFYGQITPPELPFTEHDMLRLAEQVLKSHKTVTGVQPKLSLGIERIRNSERPERFTIVGLWGEFILKPQTEHFKNLPEIEDLTMHLARIAGIKTVDHSLIYLHSGQLAYITRRIDRQKGSKKSGGVKKLHMEDMCQLTERLTEHKYKGSYEQIAKAILKYSANPGFDVISFYEQVVFSFLTGNNDMHLKNFSLLRTDKLSHSLCPAYDLVASALVLPEDDEELALTLNGKKKRLLRKDFEGAMRQARIEDRAAENVFRKFTMVMQQWHEMIDLSFVPTDLKKSYHDLIDTKLKQLGLEPG